MHLTPPLSLFALATTALAETVKWNIDTVGIFSHWRSIIVNHTDELYSMMRQEPVTILVPTSDAVDRWMKEENYESMTDKDISQLLRYHVIRGSFKAEDFHKGKNGPFLRTMLDTDVNMGQRLLVEEKGEEELSRGISFYSGFGRESGLFFPDFDADDDGVWMHAIERVLTPPPPMEDVAMAGDLTSVLGAANMMNLDWWDDPGATYFLPTNRAMQDVGAAINDASDEEMKKILQYHYVNSTQFPLYTGNIKDPQYQSALGEDLAFTYTDDDELFINNAKVIKYNYLTKNGVVHIIDQVLNPNDPSSREARHSPYSVTAFPDGPKPDQAPYVDDLVIPAQKKTLEHGLQNIPLGPLAGKNNHDSFLTGTNFDDGLEGS